MNERIKKLRRALGLTQQEFADKIGMKRNTVANYETNRNEPSNSVISLICREFNVSETWLRTGGGEMLVQMPKSEVLEQQLREFIKGGSDTFRERLISLLLRLPPEHWEMLQHYAQELIDSRPPQPVAPALAPTLPSAGCGADPVAALIEELAELKHQNQEIIRQNQEMAAELAAIKEEDAEREADQGEFAETEEKLSTFAEEKKMLA